MKMLKLTRSKIQELKTQKCFDNEQTRYMLFQGAFTNKLTLQPFLSVTFMA